MNKFNGKLKLYTTFLLFTFFFLFLIKFFNISYPLHITTTTKSTELAVVGEGKIEVRPDIAYVDAGIDVRNQATVEAAQKKVDEILQTVERVNYQQAE